MARKSLIAREKKRKRLVEKFAEKRPVKGRRALG